MSPTVTIILIIVILAVVAAIVYGVQAGRRRKLRSTFGPEYDRVVADTGNRTEAEKELRDREKRHAELQLKELSPESKATYSAAWAEVQILFVDNPGKAVATADDLVTRLIAERGYPTGEYDERLANLSVEHANTLQHYRDAHDISERSRAGSATTEDLRVALVHYRALFADLLGTDPVPTADAAADPARADSTRDHAARTDTAATDTDRARTDTAATDTDRGRTDTTPADPDRTDTDRVDTTRTDSTRTDSARTEDRPAPAPRRAADDTTDVAPDTRRR